MIRMYAVAYPKEYKNFVEAGATAKFGEVAVWNSKKFQMVKDSSFIRVGNFWKLSRDKSNRKWKIDPISKTVMDSNRLARIMADLYCSASMISIILENDWIKKDSKKYFPKGCGFLVENLMESYKLAEQMYLELGSNHNESTFIQKEK